MRIVDRRLNPGGKSFSNRQRFLRRVRDTVERAVREASRERAIENLENAQEVTVPAEGAREPVFRQITGERRDFVLPGNRDYVEGDLIDRPMNEGGGGGREAGRGHGEEDAFRFVLTREEFLSIFLDDLELPDFAKRGLVDAQKLGSRRAGYTTSGTPANLSLGRTMQLSLARRIAMGRPMRRTVERLEEASAGATEKEIAELLNEELRAVRARRMRIPFLDPVDLRYRHFERFPKPVAQAVMFCLMDVSGSMTEHMKDLAKRFFMLLHVFLTRRYQRVEIVFIRHTDEAQEVDEETFFRSAETGGTTVSSALVEMHRIISDRYDPSNWNIYGAQASDGDNMISDNDRTRLLLQDKILPLCQYFAYLEVADSNEMSPAAYFGASSLWAAYAPLAASARNFKMRRVSRRDHIYPVFRELFQKREGSSAEAAT